MHHPSSPAPTTATTTDPISTAHQKRKGSVFIGKSQEPEAFAALTKNETGEFVSTSPQAPQATPDSSLKLGSKILSLAFQKTS